MKPTQSESHSAENTYFLLKKILEYNHRKESFSDAKLIRDDPGCHPNTIRNIRTKLLNQGIIQQDSNQKLLNNEKQYTIVSIDDAKSLQEKCSKLFTRNDTNRYMGKFYKRFGIRIKKILNVKYFSKKITQEFPLKKYMQNFCPNCSKKGLRQLKQNSRPLDRRCHYCKINFQYGENSEGIMYAIKKK